MILPTVNAFLREYRIGAMRLLKELSMDSQELIEKDEENEVKENRAGKKKVSIKILAPTNDLVNMIIDEMGIRSREPSLKDKKTSAFSCFLLQMKTIFNLFK